MSERVDAVLGAVQAILVFVIVALLFYCVMEIGTKAIEEAAKGYK